MTCLCCGADVYATPATVAPFVAARTGVDQRTRTLDCPACGFAQSEHRFTDEEMAALYAGYRGEAYTEERERFEPGYQAAYGRLDDVRDYIWDVEAMISYAAAGKPILRILDVGGNDGANTPFLGRAEVDVLDVSDVPMVRFASRVAEPVGRYDVAVLAHVLEHAPDPLAMLRDAVAIADLVYVEVPADPVPSVWHEHINVFTPAALHELARRAGVRAVDFRRAGTTLGPVLMSVFA